MGPSQTSNKQKLQKPNENFLQMEIYPESNKLLGQVYVGSSISLNRWASDLIKVGQSQPQHILIPKQSKVVEKSPCGEGMRLEIEFECYYIPLSQQIGKRGQCQKYLQQPQMWYLMYCLVQSAASCHKIGSRIGDVKPQNVLLNRSGKIKLLSKLSLPNYCDLILDCRRKYFFPSPEELQIISKSYKECHINKILSQSFSIGMTILSAGILQNLFKCYDYEKVELNMLEFNKVITFWRQNEFYSEFQKEKMQYSSKMKDIVEGLLAINPDKRISSLQVYDLLKPHITAIMKMDPFSLQSRKKSPIAKLEFISKYGTQQKIHMLRSKKKGQKLQLQSPPKKELNSQRVKYSPNIGLQFSFRTPGTETEKRQYNMNESIEETKSPTHKIKLSNTFNILQHLEDSK